MCKTLTSSAGVVDSGTAPDSRKSDGPPPCRIACPMLACAGDGTCPNADPGRCPTHCAPTPDAGGAKDSGGETPPASCSGLDVCTCFLTSGYAPIAAACWCSFTLNAILPAHASTAASFGLSGALRRQMAIVLGLNRASRLFVQLSLARPSMARPSMVCARRLPPNASPNALPR